MRVATGDFCTRTTEDRGERLFAHLFIFIFFSLPHHREERAVQKQQVAWEKHSIKHDDGGSADMEDAGEDVRDD